MKRNIRVYSKEQAVCLLQNVLSKWSLDFNPRAVFEVVKFLFPTLTWVFGFRTVYIKIYKPKSALLCQI